MIDFMENLEPEGRHQSARAIVKLAFHNTDYLSERDLRDLVSYLHYILSSSPTMIRANSDDIAALISRLERANDSSGDHPPQQTSAQARLQQMAQSMTDANPFAAEELGEQLRQQAEEHRSSLTPRAGTGVTMRWNSVKGEVEFNQFGG